MRSVALLLTGASLFAVASAMCHHGTFLAPRSEEPAAKPSFGYNELDGPLNWHGLSAENEACALGKNQSPINVDTVTCPSVHGHDISFNVDPYPDGAEFENLGTTLEVVVNGSLSLGGVAYSLKQFHFHTPSEHRINGEFYPMEIHFVYQSDHETLAVVGVPVELGGEADGSQILNSIFKNLDHATRPGNTTHTAGLDFTPLKRHVERADVHQYSGSLTTPPCSEGVSWNVVRQPLLIDYQLFNQVKSVIGFNSRYAQNTLGEMNLLDHARVVLDG